MAAVGAMFPAQLLPVVQLLLAPPASHVKVAAAAAPDPTVSATATAIKTQAGRRHVMKFIMHRDIGKT